MKKQLNVTCRAALVAITAGAFCFAQQAYAAESASASPAAAKAATSATQLDSKDRDFMMTAAKGGMMEVHMGQMGVKQGQSADVKKLGNMMITDHTKANNQLMALAATKGVKLDTRHKMDKIDAAKFDQEWLTQMVAGHQKTIAAFESEAKNGKDADVKGWAAKTLPTLKMHLKKVQEAQGKMQKTS